MTRALAALAARYVGRRVLLHNGTRGTITRVTARGFTVTVPDIRHDDIARYLDD